MINRENTDGDMPCLREERRNVMTHRGDLIVSGE